MLSNPGGDASSLHFKKKPNETKNKKEKSIKVPTVFLSLSPLPSSLKTDATFKYLLLHCRS